LYFDEERVYIIPEVISCCIDKNYIKVLLWEWDNSSISLYKVYIGTYVAHLPGNGYH